MESQQDNCTSLMGRSLKTGLHETPKRRQLRQGHTGLGELRLRLLHPRVRGGSPSGMQAGSWGDGALSVGERGAQIQDRRGHALAQWLSWLKHRPTNRLCVQSLVRACARVAGSIPSRGTYRRQVIDVSLSHRCLSLSLSLPLKSMNIFSGEEKKRG